MRKVIGKAISGDKVLGYYVQGDIERVYPIEEVNEGIDNHTISDFNEDDLFVLDDVGFIVNDVVDHSLVNICLALRRLGQLGRVKLDESVHRVPNNKHLFSYIEYCGRSVLDFVKEYLAHLQPYMIRREPGQEPSRDFICVVDEIYAVDLYIKVVNTQFKEAIISFHESYAKGVSHSNRTRTYMPEYVPIIAETVLARYADTNKYCVSTTIIRGMTMLSFDFVGEKHGNCYMVLYSQISGRFMELVQEYLVDAYESVSDIGTRRVHGLSNMFNMSFSSWSKAPVSVVSILIDSLLSDSSRANRMLVDTILSTYLRSLPLSEKERMRLYDVLIERFSVSDSPLKVNPILGRVHDLLCTTDVPEVLELTPEQEKQYLMIPPAVRDNWQGTKLELLEQFKDFF